MKCVISTVRFVVAVVCLVSAVPGCEDKAADEAGKDKPSATTSQDPGAPVPQEDVEPNLRDLLQEIRTAAHGGNLARARMLTEGLLPDAERLRQVLVDEVAEDFAAKAVADERARLPEGDGLAWMFVANKDETELTVFAASTESLWMRKGASPAAVHFPTGATDAAKTVLRLGVAFYMVEAREPGTDPEVERGTHHGPFYWDGSRWTYLGSPWRLLQGGAPAGNLTPAECDALFAHQQTLMEKADPKAGHVVGKNFGKEGKLRCDEQGLPRTVYDCRLVARDLVEWGACEPD